MEEGGFQQVLKVTEQANTFIYIRFLFVLGCMVGSVGGFWSACVVEIMGTDTKFPSGFLRISIQDPI